MNSQLLTNTAKSLVVKCKGLLAADESFGTIEKRFDSIAIESTEQNRQAYRQMLLTTPGIEDYISGVILFDETIRQRTTDGVPFPELLVSRGIIPGIKVDEGAKDLAMFPGEKVTEGLDGLRERLEDYSKLGARFTKWRAVITIGDGIPTNFCIAVNAHALARFAALSQEADLVPIVEPEVLMDGDHSVERCEEVTTRTLQKVFRELIKHRVFLEGLLLKTNMVLPGKKSSAQATPEQIAESTIRCLRRSVPPAVPGIVFLSGGQTPQQAAENLNAISLTGSQPWELSFSFARALQEPSLSAWKGEATNVPEAQRLFHHYAQICSAARCEEG